MQTLTKPHAKLKIGSFEDKTFQIKEKLIRSKTTLDFKLYQKLLLIFLASCAFLIFPESPKESEFLCKKYHSQKVCVVW